MSASQFSVTHFLFLPELKIVNRSSNVISWLWTQNVSLAGFLHRGVQLHRQRGLHQHRQRAFALRLQQQRGRLQLRRHGGRGLFPWQRLFPRAWLLLSLHEQHQGPETRRPARSRFLRYVFMNYIIIMFAINILNNIMLWLKRFFWGSRHSGRHDRSKSQEFICQLWYLNQVYDQRRASMNLLVGDIWKPFGFSLWTG